MVGIKKNKTCDEAAAAAGAMWLANKMLKNRAKSQLAKKTAEQATKKKLEREGVKDVDEIAAKSAKAGDEALMASEKELVKETVVNATKEELSAAGKAAGDGVVDSLVEEGVVVGTEEGAAVATAATLQAGTAAAGAAAAPETAGLSIVAAAAAIGVEIAAQALATWLSTFWKHCPCGWNFKNLIVPICYKGKCSDEFGEGYREAKGSSDSACIKCPKGYTNMGAWCGRGWSMKDNHYKIRKTHAALLKKPDCSKHRLSDNKIFNYSMYGLVTFIVLFLFYYIIRGMIKDASQTNIPPAYNGYEQL